MSNTQKLLRITTSPISDTKLIERAKADDRQAFHLLVQRHEQQVRATVIGMLGDVVQADDVAQEVFIRFYRSIDDFRGDARLATYLSRIAINLSLNEIKRRQRRQQRFIWSPPERSAVEVRDESADPERQDNRQWVWRALQELSPEYRAVVVLRMIDGYSVSETAKILNLPQGTVASRLSRGLEKLKPILINLASPKPTRS